MTRDTWRDRRVLVTGARGFIASHLCQRLLDVGAAVHGVSRQVQTSERLPIHWWPADISDASASRHLIERIHPDVVFHLAGHVVGRQDISEVQPTFSMNLASTVHLLTAVAETNRCRVVLAGSMQEPHPDAMAGIPCSPYAASKWACSAYARMFNVLYGIPVVIARLFMVYGPGQWDTTKLLPYVILTLLQGESPKVSSGARALDWVYIDDVVDALLLLGATGPADGSATDIGSGTLTTIRGLIDRVRELLGSETPIAYGAVPDRPLEQPNAADIERTRRVVGWTAATPLDEGLTRTIAWYRTQLEQTFV